MRLKIETVRDAKIKVWHTHGRSDGRSKINRSVTFIFDTVIYSLFRARDSTMEYNPHYYPHSKYYFAQKQLGYGPLNYVYANRPYRMVNWEWPLCDILNTLPSEYAFRKVRVSLSFVTKSKQNLSEIECF